MNIDNFKIFVKNNPSLITYVKNNHVSWQDMYEIYDLYGDDKTIWNKYILSSDNKKNSSFVNILEELKNMDINKIQSSISSLEKAINLFSEMVEKTPPKDNYSKRAVYKRFDD